MGASYLSDPLVFLIQVTLGSYALLVLLRFLLQLVRADFYNPFSQFVVKLTTPVLQPVRRLVPGLAGMDVSALLVAWLLTVVELSLVLLVQGQGFPAIGPFLWAIPELVDMLFLIFIVAIIVLAVLSWVSQGGYNPVAAVFYALASPILRPIQRFVRPISGIDLSPFVALIVLMILKMLVVRPLLVLTGSPFGF